MSPTQRTLKLLRDQGYRVAIVEHWNSYAKIRQDLFGFIDLLAMKQGEPLLGIQCTTMSNMSKREQKILESPNYPLWLSTGNQIAVIGWAKRGPRGKLKAWTYQVTEMLGVITGELNDPTRTAGNANLTIE